jgi:hypothetical protein
MSRAGALPIRRALPGRLTSIGRGRRAELREEQGRSDLAVVRCNDDGYAAARVAELVESVAKMLIGNRRSDSGDGGQEQRASKEFLDERRAHPRRVGDGRCEVDDSEIEALSVQLDQASTPVGVGERDLDREIDPPGRSTSARSSTSRRFVVSANTMSASFSRPSISFSRSNSNGPWPLCR